MFGWWKEFLKRLAEANAREFGNRRPDCCDFKKSMGQSSGAKK